MEFDVLLTQIWGGSVSLEEMEGQSPLAGLLTSMVNVPIVVLTTSAKVERPFACMESTELMDGISLGDVLAEEIELEVPYGAMVLFEPRGFYDERVLSATNLGELLGLALLDVAHPSAPAKFKSNNAESIDLGNPIVALSDFAQNSANRLQ